MGTDEPRVPHVAGPENAGVEGLNVEDSRVLPHREAAVVDGRRTDSTGEGDRMPPSPSATVRATPPVWPEVWCAWRSRAGAEARMAPRTVRLVPKCSKPHEPTSPAAMHARLHEDPPTPHTIRYQESRRPDDTRISKQRNPMVRRYDSGLMKPRTHRATYATCYRDPLSGVTHGYTVPHIRSLCW